MTNQNFKYIIITPVLTESKYNIYMEGIIKILQKYSIWKDYVMLILYYEMIMWWELFFVLRYSGKIIGRENSKMNFHE